MSDRRLDRFSDPNRIVAKQVPSERRMIRPANRATAFREHCRQSASLLIAERDEIDRLSPFGRFLGTPGHRHLADDGRKQRGSMPPANQVQAFERLVDEVERVSVVGEGPPRFGGQQGVGERSGRKTLGDRREQGTLGRLAMASLWEGQWQSQCRDRNLLRDPSALLDHCAKRHPRFAQSRHPRQ